MRSWCHFWRRPSSKPLESDQSLNRISRHRDPPLSPDQLQSHWTDLNRRFFSGILPTIPIQWSGRLTSSVGMFSSLVGPRSPAPSNRPRRLIRLSLPLLSRLADTNPYAEQEILNTLAHEMIHQWQYDVLKRRPGHRLDFLRKMTEMNRSGLVGITLYHSLNEQVQAVARYRWRCQQCGRDYHRARRTIKEHRHRCGACHGRLLALSLESSPPQPDTRPRPLRQSTFSFASR